MDYDKYLIESQETFDGVDQEKDYYERKEKAEQEAIRITAVIVLKVITLPYYIRSDLWIENS